MLLVQDFTKFIRDADLLDGVHIRSDSLEEFFYTYAGDDSLMDPYQVPVSSSSSPTDLCVQFEPALIALAELRNVSLAQFLRQYIAVIINPMVGAFAKDPVRQILNVSPSRTLCHTSAFPRRGLPLTCKQFVHACWMRAALRHIA